MALNPALLVSARLGDWTCSGSARSFWSARKATGMIFYPMSEEFSDVKKNGILHAEKSVVLL